MQKLYFTFGTDPKYPYGINDYIVIYGTDRSDCINTFRKKHPNRPGSDAYNAADSYTKEKWKEISDKYYKDIAPKEIFISDALYGSKPEGFKDLWINVPLKSMLIYIQEGSGDNLTKEDMEEGYVDYLDYTIYEMDCGEIKEYDGGQLMFSYMIHDCYGCLADTIPEILEEIFNDDSLSVQILITERKG